MATTVWRQEIGEQRIARFDFDPALQTDRALSSPPTVTSARLTGTGANVTVSGIALDPTSRRATCMLRSTAAGRFRITATGSVTGGQTIVIYALLDVGAAPS